MKHSVRRTFQRHQNSMPAQGHSEYHKETVGCFSGIHVSQTKLVVTKSWGDLRLLGPDEPIDAPIKCTTNHLELAPENEAEIRRLFHTLCDSVLALEWTMKLGPIQFHVT